MVIIRILGGTITSQESIIIHLKYCKNKKFAENSSKNLASIGSGLCKLIKIKKYLKTASFSLSKCQLKTVSVCICKHLSLLELICFW